MQDPQKLQEENERLIVELAAYKEAEKARKQKKGRFIKRLSSFGSWFFLGGDFKASIKKLVVEVRDKDKQLSNDTLADVLAHGAWRFTRIGCFAVVMALIPFAILGVQTTLLYYQNQKIDTQNELFAKQDSLLEIQNNLITSQNNRLDQQTHLQEAARRSSLVFLFSNIMDAIDRELKGTENKNRNLSPQLRGRIIALSTRLKPYRYLDGDTLINKNLSPERGQLIISLIKSELNDSTLSSILVQGNWSYAYLSDVSLRGAYLSGADLRGAYLNNAYLSATDLTYADLNGAYLSNADLNGADLNGADLRDADLNGAYLSNADLNGADLNGADLNGAKTKSLGFIDELLDKWQIKGKEEMQKKYYVDSTPQYFSWEAKDNPHYIIKKRKTNE